MTFLLAACGSADVEVAAVGSGPCDSPDRLVAVTYVGSGDGLDVVAVTRSGKVAAVTDDGVSIEPDVSANGELVAFLKGTELALSENGAGPNELWVSELSGTGARRVYSGTSRLSDVAVSPDGRTLIAAEQNPAAVNGARVTSTRLFTVDVNSSQRAPLELSAPKQGLGGDERVAFSPSGDRIAFLRREVTTDPNDVTKDLSEATTLFVATWPALQMSEVADVPEGSLAVSWDATGELVIVSGIEGEVALDAAGPSYVATAYNVQDDNLGAVMQTWDALPAPAVGDSGAVQQVLAIDPSPGRLVSAGPDGEKAADLSKNGDSWGTPAPAPCRQRQPASSGGES